jgi:hypothetical protein
MAKVMPTLISLIQQRHPGVTLLSPCEPNVLREIVPVIAHGGGFMAEKGVVDLELTERVRQGVNVFRFAVLDDVAFVSLITTG